MAKPIIERISMFILRRGRIEGGAETVAITRLGGIIVVPIE
jgi:hypothetical protein